MLPLVYKLEAYMTSNDLDKSLNSPSVPVRLVEVIVVVVFGSSHPTFDRN